MVLKRIYVDANPRQAVYLVEGELPKITTFSGVTIGPEFQGYIEVPYCELEAIKIALDAQEDGQEIELIGDNEVAMKCLSLEYGIHKTRLRNKCFEIWNMMTAKKLKVTFKWVNRTENIAGKVLG